MIDQNACDAARLFDEPAIGPLEDQVLGALEEHDTTHAAWAETRKALEPLFVRTLSAWLHAGVVIDIHDRSGKQPRCLWIVRVGSGNARGASTFRIVGAPSVMVDPRGEPSFSEWSVRAVAISNKTGREMNGNTPNRRTTIDGSVTLTGRVFHDGFSELTGAQLQQHERDAFIRMVADAEAILVARSDGTDGARQ
ncbi:hypothetical protein [Variovorax gossypii]|jgi:hypothetical protein